MYFPPTVGEPARERHPAYIRGRRDRSPHDPGAPRSPCGPRVHALPAGALGRACHRNLPRILPRHGKINVYSEITWLAICQTISRAWCKTIVTTCTSFYIGSYNSFAPSP